MDNEQFFFHSYRHPVPRGLSPSDHLLLRYTRHLAALTIACAPPKANPTSARLQQFFPSLYSFRAHDSSRDLTRGLPSVYLPLDWRTNVPSPPLRKHLPVDALAHLTLPLQEGLTCLCLVLHAPSPPGTNIPPPPSS